MTRDNLVMSMRTGILPVGSFAGFHRLKSPMQDF